ncbi:MAG TPA: sulfatase-like hydrolase/transferase [Bryobacteraceae bacterium]|nr:sulfatase-like hydrolase/transferase [Bryobacteraceae bacterium]
MLYSRSLSLFAIIAATCAAQTPVILISVDTLRADRIGARTPGFNLYANGGTVFSAAESQIPLTLPSHTALFTSTYPFENGVEQNASHVPAGLRTLAEELRGHGYSTGAFIGSIFLERELGLDRGFETYDSPFSFEAFSRLSGAMLFAGGPHNPYSVRERRPGAFVLRAADQWLASRKGQNVFAFVHLFDMHQPYTEGSYDAQLVSVDKLLASFAATLKREGWWDKALVVIVSDHGEGLGDHGESDHGYFVYESTLHVPFIVHWPAGKARLGAVVDKPAGLIDFAPTVLDFLGIAIPASFRGHSLLRTGGAPPVSESTYGRDCFGWAPLRAIRSDGWKYIDAPRPELFDLSKDPHEMRNLFAAEPSVASRLREQLKSVIAAGAAPGPAQSGDPERDRKALQSLGYLAPGPHTTSSGGGADPKDKLPELLRYEDALVLMEEGRNAEAVQKFRAILASDPGNRLARRDLGVTLIDMHRYAEALGELQKVAASSVDDYVTRYELGIAHEALGRLPEAKSQFEDACRLAPHAAQCAQALERVNRALSDAGPKKTL